MAVQIKFGEMALQMRMISIDQLEEGLRMQEDGRIRGVDRTLGALLHDRGILDLVQCEHVLRTMGLPPDRVRQIPDIELSQLLGRGASGAVYRGRSLVLNEDVAVKVRAPKAGMDDPGGNRFRAEARIGQRLVHPNIVRLYDAGETRDFIYHVQELVDGAALDVILKQQQRLDERHCADIGMQIASALELAGRENIIHRDIKPANILLARTGRAKLCDMGLAKDMNRNTMMTADGVLLGSPFYIAPEYASTGDLDTRSDIYSLGVTLYHCATGVVPFPGRSAIEILQKVVNQIPPSPRTILPALSEPFCQVIMRMMAKAPNDRFQTPAEVAAVMRALKAGEPIVMAAKPGFWSRLFGVFKKKQPAKA